MECTVWHHPIASTFLPRYIEVAWQTALTALKWLGALNGWTMYTNYLQLDPWPGWAPIELCKLWPSVYTNMVVSCVTLGCLQYYVYWAMHTNFMQCIWKHQVQHCQLSEQDLWANTVHDWYGTRLIWLDVVQLIYWTQIFKCSPSQY